MSNPSKSKGSAWERRVVDFLVANGHPNAERRALEGINDRGDVAGVRGWVVEAKCRKTLDLSGWSDEAEREALNAGVSRWAVVFPRRNHATAKGYALVPIWLLAELMLPDSPCPHVRTSGEGTSYCTLAERQGTVPEREPIECNMCHGNGDVQVLNDGEQVDGAWSWETCTYCNGKGYM